MHSSEGTRTGSFEIPVKTRILASGESDLEASFIEPLKQLPSLRLLRWMALPIDIADEVVDSLDITVQS